jgi:hypothetical protein
MSTPMQTKQGRPALSLRDSIMPIALLVGVFLVVIVPHLLFKAGLLIGVCVGFVLFTRKSHWTRQWSRTKQNWVAASCVIGLSALSSPQFITQWRAVHPRVVAVTAPPDATPQLLPPKAESTDEQRKESPKVKQSPTIIKSCNPAPVELSPAVAKFWDAIEEQYHEPIRCEWHSLASLGNDLGESGCRPLDPLNIRLATSFQGDRQQTETEVLHELFHRKFWDCDFSGAVLRGLKHETTPLEAPDILRSAGYILAIIEHNYFFPKMRAMGFEPVTTIQRQKFEDDVHTPGPTRHPALDYLYVALLMNEKPDKDFRKRWDAYYDGLNLQREKKNALELKRLIIETKNPLNRVEVTQTIDACLDVLTR